MRQRRYCFKVWRKTLILTKIGVFCTNIKSPWIND